MNSSGDSQYLGELAPAASIPSPHERKDRHMVPLLPGHPAGAGAVAAAAATTGTATSQQDAAYDRTLIRELFKLGSQVAQMQCSALLNVKRQQVPYITISFYSSNDYISMRP